MLFSKPRFNKLRKIVLVSLIYSFNLCATELPEWINDPSTLCREEEFCTVGEGPGSMISEVEARKSMAKIFETKVRSEQKIITEALSKQGAEGVVSGEVNEEIFGRILESTEQTLIGVEIRKKYEGKESYFALAVLDRNKAAKRIASEISSLDEVNKEFMKEDRRRSLNIVLKNFMIRESLNSRHVLLVNRSISNPITINDVLKRKRIKRNLNVKVKAIVSELLDSSEIRSQVLSLLSNNDFLIADKKSDKFKYLIKIDLKKEKQYFNVKGFVKFKFILKATSLNRKGVKLGSLDYTIVQTGRNFTQAYSNALPGIKNFLNMNLDELQID